MSAVSLNDQITNAIIAAMPDAVVAVEGAGGHFSISVTSKEFEGKGLLAKQRLVYSAITPFMAGASAPVHAVDRLETLTP